VRYKGGHGRFPTISAGAIFFATSAISVVTGGTSPITVPAMFQFDIDPQTALATNMFALTFMSAGGTISISSAYRCSLR
jgi:uncharacterized membrane protein YfcA